jgi:hypothetical protein
LRPITAAPILGAMRQAAIAAIDGINGKAE